MSVLHLLFTPKLSVFREAAGHLVPYKAVGTETPDYQDRISPLKCRNVRM